MDLLALVPDAEQLRNFLSDALSNEFSRTCFVFTLAAYVHSRQVRAEIRTQIGELVSALKSDLSATKDSLGSLGGRVTRIEEALKPK